MADDPDLFEDGSGDWDWHADAAAARAGQRGIRNKMRKRKGLEPEPEGDQGEEKRGPGRPKGSPNRKSVAFEKLYAAKGFKDPLMVMGQFITMSPLELQAWLIENEMAEVQSGKTRQPALAQLIEIIKEQHKVASDLAPYLHGKKPTEIQIIDERLPQLIIDLGTDQLTEARAIAAGKALSAGSPIEEAEYSEIKDLEGEE
ncbi:MAG: hypothetical protein CMF72_22810 [Mameliella sp.]|nr:hypothetical protein [Mameliella sp.]|tara:strand:- start:2679 stop:3281 length:603 start_codon:yes stop_codon:yes gene_type:complete